MLSNNTSPAIKHGMHFHLPLGYVTLDDSTGAGQ